MNVVLLYINDLVESVSPHIRLFADDGVLNRDINGTEGIVLLEDADTIFSWCDR